MSAPVPRVLVDGRLLRRRQTGVATYIRELQRALDALGPAAVEAHFALGPPALPRRNRLTRLGNLTIDLAWLHGGIPAMSQRLRADIVHAPVNWLPLWSPGKSVVTVQDVAWERVPDVYPEFFRRYARLFTHRSVRRADAVITTSRSTADDLTELYGVPRRKIWIVPIGVHIDPELPAEVREPFILHVGEFEPRKRVLELIEGHRRYVAGGVPGERCRLVLAGSGGRLEHEARTLMGEDCTMLGFVSDEQLRDLYRRARLLVMPSDYEGFGLPVAEAAGHGCPALVANNSSLPEVAGASGLMLRDSDPESIADALGAALANPEALRERGAAAWADARERFSWEQAARQTVDVYARTLA